MAEHICTHKLPAEAGGGKVEFYRVTADSELPYVVNPEEVAGARWVCVLFPERWAWKVKTKAAGLRDVRGGPELADKLVARVSKKAKKKAKPAKKKVKARATHTRAHAVAKKVTQKAAKAPSEPAQSLENKGNEAPSEGDAGGDKKPREFASLDEAMDEAFPLSRLVREHDALMQASEPIYSKEGDYVGDKPAFFVRLAAVKMGYEYREGRAREREKPAPKAKRVGLEELQEMLTESEEACQAMEGLIRKSRARRAMAKAGGGAAKPTPAPAS